MLNLAWGWPLGVAGFWWGEGRGQANRRNFLAGWVVGPPSV